MPPESVRETASRLSQSASSLQPAFDASARDPAADAVEARLVEQDGRHLLELVEIDLLRHDSETGLGGLELDVDVAAEDEHLPGGLGHERGDDADRRGLAGAVRAEQREEVPGLDVEVDALQCVYAVAVGLRELAQGKCGHDTTRADGGPAA